MLPIYMGSLALGGVFIVTSILFGSSDADVDADLDADLDADFDADLDADEAVMAVFEDPAEALVDTGAWIPFLSLRFWTFALAAFGLSGVLLELLGVGGFVGGIVSVLLGMVVGTGAAWTFRVLQTSQVSGNIGMNDVRGKEATVLLPVGPDKLGKIRLLVDSQYVDLPAVTQCESLIDRQQTVLIIDVEDGIANITPVPIGYQSMKKD